MFQFGAKCICDGGTCVPESKERRYIRLDKELLKDSVDVLKHIRTELYGTVESSVISRLDKVIKDLETAQGNGTEIAVRALDVLFVLGSVIEKLPEIAGAIQYLETLLRQ